MNNEKKIKIFSTTAIIAVFIITLVSSFNSSKKPSLEDGAVPVYSGRIIKKSPTSESLVESTSVPSPSPSPSPHVPSTISLDISRELFDYFNDEQKGELIKTYSNTGNTEEAVNNLALVLDDDSEMLRTAKNLLENKDLNDSQDYSMPSSAGSVEYEPYSSPKSNYNNDYVYNFDRNNGDDYSTNSYLNDNDYDYSYKPATTPEPKGVTVIGKSSSYRTIGNTTYGSDGDTYRTIGNTTYSNSGDTYRTIGNTTYGSDGSTARTIGNSTYLNY